MLIKHPLQSWAAALSLLVCCSAFADTVTLKSGEKISGKVISENDKEVVIEEQISAGITDARTIARSDVAKIDKEMPDAAAYQAIKNVKPGPNSLPATAYDSKIKPLEAFVAQHPQSAHVAEIKANLAAFEEEQKRVADGAVKLNGQWLSKEEAEKERYQINAQLVLNHMRDQFRSSDLIGAMNTFDQLEQTYPGSRAYPEAVELAKQILPNLKNAAVNAGKTWQFQKAERDKGIQLLSEPAKSQTIAANEREQKAADAAVEAANRANQKWPPLIARSETALNAINSRATEEAKRLAALEVGKMKESIKVVEEARKHLAAKEFEAAETAVSKALALWGANEAATRLQAEVNAARTAAPETTTAIAAEGETAVDPAAAETATTDATKEASATAAEQTATDEAAAAGEEEVEEEKSWFLTLPGLVVTLVVVILVLAGLNALRKVSRKANDVIE